MIKHNVLFLVLILISTFSFGQKKGDYFSIPSDSSFNCRLSFVSDSTVELSNIPRHMGRKFTMIFKYTASDTSIIILPEVLTKEDTLSLNTFGFNYFIKPFIVLTKIDNGFIDSNKSIIYLKEKYYRHDPGITYIIDGKTFIQDVGVTDGLGLVRKTPKINKGLQKKLKSVAPDKCTIELVRGLEAYKRYGIKKVYGVIIITTKG